MRSVVGDKQVEEVVEQAELGPEATASRTKSRTIERQSLADADASRHDNVRIDAHENILGAVCKSSRAI